MQLVASKVALLAQLLSFPFEVCGKDFDLRLTPTYTSCVHSNALPPRCPYPLRRLESRTSPLLASVAGSSLPSVGGGALPRSLCAYLMPNDKRLPRPGP